MAIPLKPERSWGINAVRFVFQSYSIQTNKMGWIIDDFNLGHVEVAGGLNDYSLHNRLPIYPNPSSDVFTVSYPSHYVDGDMQVYNLNGKKILNSTLTKTIDLSGFGNGIYYYRISFDGQLYTGILHKQ